MDQSTNNLKKLREDAILMFIKNNQGCSQESVIDYLVEKGLSSRKTTIKIIENMEENNIIELLKPKQNSRSYKIGLIKDNPIIDIYTKIIEFQQSFDLLVEEFLETFKKLNIDILNVESDKRIIYIISLIYCLSKLIILLLNEILLRFINKIIKDKVELNKAYQNVFSKMSEIYLSFDKLKNLLNDESLYQVSLLSKEYDLPCKIILWSLAIFCEISHFKSNLIITKKLKTQLFHTMQLIYELGKSYTTLIYDEIVYDRLTRDNKFLKFPDGNYIIPMQNELKNLDYLDFCRLLVDMGIHNEATRDTHASTLFSILAREFKGDMKNKLFFSLIQKIIANLITVESYF